MTKSEYIEQIHKSEDKEQASIIFAVAESDFDLSQKEFDEIRDESVEIFLKFFKQTNNL